MNGRGVENERLFNRLKACVLAGLLAACAQPSPWPFNSQQVVGRAPQPPQVVSANSNAKNLPPCPQPLIAQAHWLGRNFARIRLGFTKLQVVTTLGDPARAETFGLNNGAVVEVLFYHTPETICRVGSQGEGLMPLVFQDDRLLGYGTGYYRQFIVPAMKMAMPLPQVQQGFDTPQGQPQPRVQMTDAPSLSPAPARTGRLVQEDLPPPVVTPPLRNYQPTPVADYGNGYSSGMNGMYPVNYVPPYGAVGRGEPLR